MLLAVKNITSMNNFFRFSFSALFISLSFFSFGQSSQDSINVDTTLQEQVAEIPVNQEVIKKIKLMRNYYLERVIS